MGLSNEEFLQKWTIDKYLQNYGVFIGKYLLVLEPKNNIEFWQGLDLLLYPLGYRIIETSNVVTSMSNSSFIILEKPMIPDTSNT